MIESVEPGTNKKKSTEDRSDVRSCVRVWFRVLLSVLSVELNITHHHVLQCVLFTPLATATRCEIPVEKCDEFSDFSTRVTPKHSEWSLASQIFLRSVQKLKWTELRTGARKRTRDRDRWKTINFVRANPRRKNFCACIGVCLIFFVQAIFRLFVRCVRKCVQVSRVPCVPRGFFTRVHEGPVDPCPVWVYVWSVRVSCGCA